MRRAAILAGLLALTVASSASAHHHHGIRIDTVASGLDNPRHVAVAPDGDAAVANDHIDSNPVDVYADRGGVFVADAGGNSVLRVGPFGRVSTVAVFPNLPDLEGYQAVPTGVVRGPDGALYVSQLTGFPFPVGGAKIFRVDPRGGPPTEYASGLTNGMDLAFGRDGTLYVLEIDADSLFPDVGPSTDGASFTVPWHRGTVEAQPTRAPSEADRAGRPRGRQARRALCLQSRPREGRRRGAADRPPLGRLGGAVAFAAAPPNVNGGWVGVGLERGRGAE
jgi:glucose/arabinose dehydrogenase